MELHVSNVCYCNLRLVKIKLCVALEVVWSFHVYITTCPTEVVSYGSVPSVRKHPVYQQMHTYVAFKQLN